MKKSTFAAGRIHKAARSLLAAGCILTAAAVSAEAADIWVGVQVGNRFALIDQNLNLGGNLIWGTRPGGYTGWITDRAMRGEKVTVAFYPDGREQTDRRVFGARVISSRGSFDIDPRYGAITTFTIPLDPNWDNPRVRVDTVLGPFRKDIPLGTR